MANDVFANGREVACKAGAGKTICAFPDVCFTPPDKVPATPLGIPIPYPNTGMASDTTGGSKKVKISKKEVGLKNKSCFKKSSGDEAGSAAKKGIVTSKNTGKVYFNAWSMDVKIEGQNVVRHLDLTTNNHASMPGDTPPWAYVDSVATSKVKQVKKGDIEVKVSNSCTGDPVEDVEVEVRSQKMMTNSSGITEFIQLLAGSTSVAVSKHFVDADYSTFVIHYPRILLDHEAIANFTTTASIPEGGKGNVEVKLEVYRVLTHVKLVRKHIDLGGPDKYGHWWSIDGGNSYGWWPKYPVGSADNRRSAPPSAPTPPAPDAGRLAQIQYLVAQAAYKANLMLYNALESSFAQTMRGVDGELNGQTSFGGTSTKDPHHPDPGDEEYHPVFNDCTTDAQVSNCMSGFAASYKGQWSWRFEFGNHCHTFQKRLMTHCGFDKVKVLK